MVGFNWFQFLKKKRRSKLDSPTPIFIPNLNLGFQNLLLSMNLPSLGRRIEKVKEDGDGFASLSPPFTTPKMLPSPTPCPTLFGHCSCVCSNVLAISLCTQPWR